MSFQTIDRKSKLFTRVVSDEINKIISNIDDQIDNLYAPPIAYKIPVTDVYFRLLRYKDVLHLNNSSIRIGSEVRIHLEFDVRQTGTIEGLLTKSPYKFGSDIPVMAVGTDNNTYQFILKANGNVNIVASNVTKGSTIILEYTIIL
ncbi:MAG: hypothetical protein U0L18_09080 [Acutalibacteraceae bacterium]|nr:hypothetical protein [Acutalibacteraceae bacterium]